VPTQDGANQLALSLRNEAEAGVASQIGGDGRACVGCAQADTLAALPKREDGIVISDVKGPQDGLFGHRTVERV
jgi:hypothetical protein